MRADGRAEIHFAGFVAVSSEFFPIETQDFSVADFEFIDRTGLRAPEAVADHIKRVVEILLQVAPRAAMEFFSVNSEEIEPRVLPAKKPVPGHHCAQRSQRETIAAKTGGNELVPCVLTDEGQAIVGFYHLSQPA